MRGLSTWLFSKVVMFVFLTSVFAIMAGVLALVNERSYANSAEALTIQLSDGLQGIIFSSSTYAQKVVPIPERIPDDGSKLAERVYMIEFGKTASDSLYTAISWDNRSVNPKYASSASIYYPAGTRFKGLVVSGVCPYGCLRISPSGYRYILFIKNVTATTQICIKACKTGDFTTCTPCA